MVRERRVAEKAGLLKEATRIVRPEGEGIIVFVEDYTPGIAALDAPQVVSRLAELGVQGSIQRAETTIISDPDYAASLIGDAYVWVWQGSDQPGTRVVGYAPAGYRLG